MTNTQQRLAHAYFSPEGCELTDFQKLVEQELTPQDVPLAKTIEKNIPIYDMGALGSMLGEAEARRDLMAEWAYGLRDGAGVLVLQGAYRDVSPIDAASEVFEEIIAQEKAANGGGADHFAAAGSNDRIWNALQKLCVAAPDVFARYFGNSSIAAVCEAWLGPNYQMTAQINLVRPGGAAQQAHRDYHLGFQTAETSSQYPAHVHDLSPVLTLQGAVAHTDMPVESGPTKLLPFSQQYRAGYAAWRREDFRAYFEEHCVQLPLAKGDAVFFNPALFHAAGANRSEDVQRMANLLQVSSAFGRAMETVDRRGMSERLFPALVQLKRDAVMSEPDQAAAIAACAEGYSFPTNLDRDPPVGGLAPQTQAGLFHQALAEGWTAARFTEALAAQDTRRQS
ncbi:phytanoyl-CoA dioxygenase family protein [Phaeobacter gallaeciensis]|uniref:Protein involved in biosynthesis of mitomycin antibiotics/polyketide fumonisin n=1 Tax=Phaeobacter gallaeciensis TaxID=60890 RepID=A0AAD0EC86_9RHOB|nr:phytanoyl-CoA dioxygenase family protein [Phaeobacter gallaeciensis]AHD10505.1 Protein involved in biosynthesis of mitomycin antibiotics/polyketide fumonisin [Phaeobacter gallaeciensis DSM 26640]ATE93768.1 Protein involved in biosynthesis of mitomycin antibiotics/polyketide fumonisin [Phaeobacter gallaeciensis]ATE96411.1 Protein involved in biosynthesis of mitomycin antibiotics/polyketide fumonisin [Phaeobacter gallaeciensis]ATF02432.1 Protein involved in biosynthesis of mitomycin antibiotic